MQPGSSQEDGNRVGGNARLRRHGGAVLLHGSLGTSKVFSIHEVIAFLTVIDRCVRLLAEQLEKKKYSTLIHSKLCFFFFSFFSNCALNNCLGDAAQLNHFMINHIHPWNHPSYHWKKTTFRAVFRESVNLGSFKGCLMDLKDRWREGLFWVLLPGLFKQGLSYL